MAKVIGYAFTVEGEGIFPFDMLRYDSCYPRREGDVAGLSAGYFRREEGPAARRSVNLFAKDRGPTVARWESFGWRVVAQEVVR